MVMLSIPQPANALHPGMIVEGDGQIVSVHKFNVMDKFRACDAQHVHYKTDKGKHICVHIRDIVTVREEVNLGEDANKELELKSYA